MDKAQIITLPKIPDDRGNLSFIEQQKHIPFIIERSYWIYDVPGGESRGGHAYTDVQEFIVALSGSFDVILHDGQESMSFHLSRSYYGLYIPKMMWREIENFSTNSVAFILANQKYNENSYLRDFDEFRRQTAIQR